MIQLDDGWTGEIYHEWGGPQEIFEIGIYYPHYMYMKQAKMISM